MKERGILFNSEMVKAILARDKTQTRRVITQVNELQNFSNGPRSELLYRDKRTTLWNDMTKKRFIEKHSPYGVPGDLLYVRETWARMCSEFHNSLDYSCEENEGEHYIEYRADSGNPFPGHWDKDNIEEARAEGFNPVWSPSIHMPKKYARIWLRVTNVRVERLQDITLNDARAEGIRIGGMVLGQAMMAMTGTDNMDDAQAVATQDEFVGLWNSINKKRGFPWDSNPWVWVVEFEKLTKEQEKKEQ